MNTESISPPTGDRYVTLRLFRWLFSPRKLRICLALVVGIATVIAALYTFENWRGGRAWQRTEAALQAAGERVDLAAFVPPPVPDDQNFAMTPFLAPLFAFEPGTQKWRDTNAATKIMKFFEGLPSSPPPPENMIWGKRTALAEWIALMDPASTPKDPDGAAASLVQSLRRYEPVLTELKQASTRPQARFNLRYDLDNPSEMLLPHLGVLRNAVQVLALRASAELALGQSEAALDDLQLALALTDTVKAEPSLISHLVRCACLQRVACTVWDGLAEHRWSAAQVETLQHRLERCEVWNSFTLAMQGERAFGNAMIVLVRKNPLLLVQFGAPEGSQAAASRPPWIEALLLQSIPRGWFYLEQVEYNRLFQELLLSAADTRTRRLDPAAVQNAMSSVETQLRQAGSALWHHRLLSAMLLPAPPAAYQKGARAQVVTDQAVLACALERYRLAHGQFPAALPDLVPQYLQEVPRDVIKGEPLRYQRSEPGKFVLYSLGWNGTDDGGKPGVGNKGKADFATGDWVWRSP